MGWSEIDNGRLLSVAVIEFDAIITTDQSIDISRTWLRVDWR